MFNSILMTSVVIAITIVIVTTIEVIIAIVIVMTIEVIIAIIIMVVFVLREVQAVVGEG